MKKILIIDSFALIFRAYYAYPTTLTTPDGSVINAAYGFTSLLLDTLNKFQPEYVVAVFDPQTAVNRGSEYLLYKANRSETDKELIDQIPAVKEILEDFDIPVLRVAGYEADDVIGTLVNMQDLQHLERIVVTGDQDLFQLIEDGARIYLSGRKFSDSKLFGKNEVIEKLGLEPIQVPDFKGLAGDVSDNIPGIKGIGKVTATKLLQTYGTIESIYDNIEEIKGAVKTKLLEGYNLAIQSKKLATIEKKVPLDFDYKSAKTDTFNIERVKSKFADLRFNSLLKKLKDLTGNFSSDEPLGLFSHVSSEVLKHNVKEFNNSKFKFEKTIFVSGLNAEGRALEDFGTFSSLLICGDKDSKEVFEISVDGFKSFIVSLKPKMGRIEIVTSNLKSLYNSINYREESYESVIFHDLGFMLRLITAGDYGYAPKDIRQYLDMFEVTESEVLESYHGLFQKFMNTMEDASKLYNIYNMEIELISVVLDMQSNGVTLDTDKLDEFKIFISTQKELITKEIFKEVGHEFNINSPKQVGEVLFEERGLSSTKKTKGGSYSTNEKSLQSLRSIDPLIDMVLRYRELDKLLSTYIKALPNYVSANGKIHAEFDQMGTVSGRFSSKNPNLQNIPAGETAEVIIRDAFVADKRYELIAFDYSQQELRILAAISGEENLIRAFEDGKDIHKVTASALFNKPEDDLTSLERSFGKTINFSIVYGISSFGLAERLEIGREDASELIKTFYIKYPKVKQYFDNLKKTLPHSEYAETLLGRRRSTRNLSQANSFAKQAVEREMLNFGIQGTAADLMKIVMLRLRPLMDKYHVKLLMQIHDEFVFEVPLSMGDVKTRFISDMVDIMQGVYDIGLSFKVDVKGGLRWGSMNPILL